MMNLIILSWFRCQNHFRVPYESAKTCAVMFLWKYIELSVIEKFMNYRLILKKKLSHQETQQTIVKKRTKILSLS